MRSLLLTAGLVLALALPTAAAEPAPHVTDLAGDANGVNGQGLTPAPGFGQASGPLTYAPADLLSVRYETLFVAVPVGGDGIDYQATGVAAHITTSAPAGSDAGTLIYRLNTTVGDCGGFLQAYLQGPASPPTDQADRRLEFRQFAARGCAADATLFDTRFTATSEGNVLTFTFPYTALSAADRANFAPGQFISGTQAEVRTQFGAVATVTAPAIDTAPPQATDFRIGTDDMPADVPCTTGCP